MTAPGLVNALPFSDVLLPEMVPGHEGPTVQDASESLQTPAQDPWGGQLRADPATQAPFWQVSPTVQ